MAISEVQIKVEALTAEMFEDTIADAFKPGYSSKEQGIQLVAIVEFLSSIIHLERDTGLKFLAEPDVLPSFLLFVAQFTDTFTQLEFHGKRREVLKESAIAFSGYLTWFLQYLHGSRQRPEFAKVVYPLGQFYYYHYVLNTTRNTEIVDILCGEAWHFIIEVCNHPQDKLIRLMRQKANEPRPLPQRPTKRIISHRSTSLQEISAEASKLGLDVYDIEIYDEATLNIRTDIRF